MAQKIRSRGATVIVHGENWNACDAKARERAQAAGDSALYCMPFDHPHIWSGNSSVVYEIAHDLSLVDRRAQADLIVCSVGGGGLLAGIMEGLRAVSGGSDSQASSDPHYDPHYTYDARNYRWELGGTVVVGAETAGAASFSLAKRQGAGARLERIETIASTLGALQVTVCSQEAL
jgi:L-serine/L-threonine ammonia-lyase